MSIEKGSAFLLKVGNGDVPLTYTTIAGHGTGERFLLLDQDSLTTVPDIHASRGAVVQIDAIGIGDTTPAQATEDVLGQAVMPLAPVHAVARTESGGWRFDWIRRSRAGWNWADGVETPLAEEQELYRVELIQGGAAFRSASVATPYWTYDAAAVAADTAAGVSGAVGVEIRQIGTFGPGRPAALSITI